MNRDAKTLVVAVAGAAVVALVFAIAKRFRVPVILRRRKLNEEFVASILADLPNEDSVLGEDDPRWDELLGGKLGPGVWRYYESHHGTTCGVAMGGELETAGGPPEMINRAPPGGSAQVTATGQLAGPSMGKHISKLHDGAKAQGWLRTPVNGELPDFRKGDIYCATHPSKDAAGNVLAGEHVGAVIDAGDGVHIETADGGQTDGRGRQCMKRKKRELVLSAGNIPYADGTTIPKGSTAIETPISGNAKLAWWIRVGGDDE